MPMVPSDASKKAIQQAIETRSQNKQLKSITQKDSQSGSPKSNKKPKPDFPTVPWRGASRDSLERNRREGSW